MDPNPSRRSAVGKTFARAAQFDNLDTMFASVTPELAIIASPHHFHASSAVLCLENGVAVLCEKPMATTVTECDQMIAAAEKAKRPLAVGHFRRFFPSCQMIKAVLNSGLFGAVQSFRVLEGEKYSWPAQSRSFFRRSDAGGGVLIDAGAHTIDLVLWWLGEVMTFEYSDDAMGGVEANCLINMHMRSGVNGTIQMSRDWPLSNRYVIECEKGWLTYICDVADRVEWGLHDSVYQLNTQIRMMTQTPCFQWCDDSSAAPRFSDCFVNQLRNVIAAVAGSEQVLVTGSEARKTVAFIEDCYRNRTLIDMSWLEPAEILRARQLAHV